VFERFTEPARAVVVLAQEESLSLHHNYIGTEHLLIALLRVGTGAGRRALDSLHVRLDDVRSEVVEIVGTGPVNLGEHDAEALRAIGIDLDEVRRRVEETFGAGALERKASVARHGRRWRRCSTGFIPFTPRAKKVLELALREALALGHRYLGTEHILLGLVREREGLAAVILARLGASDRLVRSVVIDELSRGDDLPGRSA
jgi:ATP-dependent Clp protease ATP-binding subunit ClpA